MLNEDKVTVNKMIIEMVFAGKDISLVYTNVVFYKGKIVSFESCNQSGETK
jgi:hypothetical protein